MSPADMLSTLAGGIAKLQGEFVVPKNNYEGPFCEALGWSVATTRYYDATFDGCLIEMKKGQSGMFFDMVRYSEIYLGEGAQGTWTVFFRYNKPQKKVTEVYVIDTRRILSFLRLDRKKAETCIRLRKDQARGLVMQASMTRKDMARMADYVISEDGGIVQRAARAAPPPWIRPVVSRTRKKEYWWHDRLRQASWSLEKWYDADAGGWR